MHTICVYKIFHVQTIVCTRDVHTKTYKKKDDFILFLTIYDIQVYKLRNYKHCKVNHSEFMNIV